MNLIQVYLKQVKPFTFCFPDLGKHPTVVLNYEL